MDNATTIEIIVAVIGSSALFSFIQFLIQRKDNKTDKIDKIYKTMEEQNMTFKEQNEILQKELKEGLDERERTGKERFLTHQEAIQKLNEAIFQLTKNDTEQTQYMKTIGESLIGLSHDKIISLSDKFLERGCITLKEKATIQSIYEPYRKLGGNSDCVVAFNYINELPIVSEEKAKKVDTEKGLN